MGWARQRPRLSSRACAETTRDAFVQMGHEILVLKNMAMAASIGKSRVHVGISFEWKRMAAAHCCILGAGLLNFALPLPQFLPRVAQGASHLYATATATDVPAHGLPETANPTTPSASYQALERVRELL